MLAYSAVLGISEVGHTYTKSECVVTSQTVLMMREDTSYNYDRIA